MPASQVNQPEAELLRLATERFGELLAAERELLEAAAVGREAVCPGAGADGDSPEHADDWPLEREIRSDMVAWLCASRAADALVHPAGIVVRGARIVGDLNLAGIELERRLFLHDCSLRDVVLKDARVGSVSLYGSHYQSLVADRLRASGTIFLHRSVAREGVSFLHARIEGSLVCEDALFAANPSGIALHADALQVDGTLYLRGGFRADGKVRLYGARIGLDLDCTGGTFRDRGGVALDLRFVTVGTTVRLDRGFRASGAVLLLSASIRSGLLCDNGSFSNPDGYAISADLLECKGGLYLRNGFRARGTIGLVGAQIAGDLDFERATCLSRNGEAVVLDGATVGGRLFLRFGFRARGEVRLRLATVDRAIDCKGGVFRGANSVAIRAAGARTNGAFHLEEACVYGVVDLASAHIGQGLGCHGATFESDETPRGGLFADGAEIGGPLIWRRVTLDDHARLVLTHATVTRLEDDDHSWPAPDHLHLAGFSYDSISGIPTSDQDRRDWLKHRLDWLRLQPATEFSPQPYEQLVRVLRQSGHEADARTVAIAKQDDRRKHGGLGKASRTANLILKGSIGHGYRPWWALLWGLLFVTVGAVVFSAGHRHGVLPAIKRPHPRFTAIGYSLDTFLPIVNLRQEDAWAPQQASLEAWAVQGYLWFHIAVGWVLTTLGVLGVTGLVRRD